MTDQLNTAVSPGYDTEFPVSANQLPFNVTLLNPVQVNLKAMTPVTSLDIYEGATTDFHPEGLFSIEIFGRVGSEARGTRFSYIDIKTPIFHPFVWICLTTIRAFYGEVCMGKAYANWDAERKDFIKATELDGETGFAFFLSHWHELVIPRGKSDSRNQRIELIEKYRGKGDLVDKVMVTPAALRDIQIDEGGRVTKDEVNDLYYRLLSVSNTVVVADRLANPKILDTPRITLQLTFNEIYTYYEGFCTGKKGMFQGKWGSRRIFNGTRNVITAMDTSTVDLDSPRTPSPLQTQLGLYQLIKGALPKTIYFLQNGWLSNVFIGDQSGAYLVNPTTLKRELKEISVETQDRWTTVEGLDKVITSFSKPAHRQEPVRIEGYYLGLIYEDEDSFKIFGDIDELPANLDRNKVSPLTLTQLIYLCGYAEWNKLICMVTRYPVSGMGSTFTSYVYVRTTIVANQKWERDESWEVDRSTDGALEFPSADPDAPFVDSLIPHSVYLVGLGADFDGDTASANILYGDLAVEENVRAFNSKNIFLDSAGEFAINPDVATVNLVLHNMTGFQTRN